MLTLTGNETAELEPGNYWLELEFERPVARETLLRALRNMGFEAVIVERDAAAGDASVGAVKLSSSKPAPAPAASATSSKFKYTPMSASTKTTAVQASHFEPAPAPAPAFKMPPPMSASTKTTAVQHSVPLAAPAPPKFKMPPPLTGPVRAVASMHAPTLSSPSPNPALSSPPKFKMPDAPSPPSPGGGGGGSGPTPDVAPSDLGTGPQWQEDTPAPSPGGGGASEFGPMASPGGGSAASSTGPVPLDKASASTSPAPASSVPWGKIALGMGVAAAALAAFAVVGGSSSTEEPYSFRLLARLPVPIRLQNQPGMWWKIVHKLAIDPFAEPSFHIEPHPLETDRVYDLRILSRDKTARSRADVEMLLEAMGFSPVIAQLKRRNMRVPRRATSVSEWIGIGTWQKPLSVVTSEDPFYFADVKLSHEEP